jgi:hypothetical protein
MIINKQQPVLKFCGVQLSLYGGESIVLWTVLDEIKSTLAVATLRKRGYVVPSGEHFTKGFEYHHQPNFHQDTNQIA